MREKKKRETENSVSRENCVVKTEQKLHTKKVLWIYICIYTMRCKGRIVITITPNACDEIARAFTIE